MLTPTQLAEIRERCDAATKGPWIEHPSELLSDVMIRLPETEAEPDSMGEPIAEVYDGDDGAFIAHARTDVPDLLAHIEEMEKQIKDSPLLESGSAVVAAVNRANAIQVRFDDLDKMAGKMAEYHDKRIKELEAQVEAAKEIADALQPGYAPKDGEYFCSYCQAKSLPVDSNHTEGCLQAMCEQLLEGGQK